MSAESACSFCTIGRAIASELSVLEGGLTWLLIEVWEKKKTKSSRPYHSKATAAAVSLFNQRLDTTV